MALVRTMRDEAVLPGGRSLASAPRLLIGGADAPREPKAGDTPTSLQAKIEAGADFFQTQFCFDMAMLKRYLAWLGDFGIPERSSIVVGIGPIRSARSARWMNENLFGVHIPTPSSPGSTAPRTRKPRGIRICVELIEELQGIEGVAGAHLMAPARRAGDRRGYCPIEAPPPRRRLNAPSAARQFRLEELPDTDLEEVNA